MVFGIYFVCAALLAFIGSTEAITIDEAKANFVGFIKDCTKENHPTAEELGWFKDHKPLKSENAKCMAACMFKKMEIMDDKGFMSKDGALSIVENIFPDDADKKDQMLKFLNACQYVNEATVSDGEKGCERASLAHSCGIENSKKFGIDWE